MGLLLDWDPITPDYRRFIGDFAEGVFGFSAYLDASSCAVDALDVCFDETREPWRDRLLLFYSCICALWGILSRVGGRCDLSWLGSVRGACSSTTCGVGMFDCPAEIILFFSASAIIFSMSFRVWPFPPK